MKTVKEFAEEISPFRARAAGAVRRMVISFTDDVLWQLAGVRFPDGSTEVREVEPFTGIGHFARPPAGVEAEAAVVMDGDAKSPMIVGVRDEATRAAVAGNLAADETATYNSKSIAHHKADGTIELRGVPQVLAPEKMPRFETYRGAEDALIGALVIALGAVSAYATAVGALGGVFAPTVPLAATLDTAIATTLADALAAFNLAAATYLARVGKVE